MPVLNILNVRYITLVSGQALVSGFHFLLNLLLLRAIEPYDYGLFALSFVLAFFAAAINNALLSTPLTVYTPVIKNTQQRQAQEALFFTINLLYLFLLCAMGIVFTLSANMEMMQVLASTAFIASYAARQYSRSFAFARLKPQIAAKGDLIYVFCGATTSCAIIVFAESPNIALLLLALAGANLFAVLIEISSLKHAAQRLWKIRDLKAYTDIWLQSRWALLGAVTTIFMAQAHSIIVSASHGAAAYAPLAAGFVLYGPVRIVLTSWQNMVRPELALMLMKKQTRQAGRRITWVSLLMGSAVIALGVALWLGWPYIYDALYAEKYANVPMGIIVLTWAMISFCAAIRNASSAVLQALTEFRLLALGTVYGALISGVLVSIVAYFFHPQSTLYSMLVAEIFLSVYVIKAAGRLLRTPGR